MKITPSLFVTFFSLTHSIVCLHIYILLTETSTIPLYQADFLIRRENDIILGEIKSETNIPSKNSMQSKQLFPNQIKRYPQLSMDNVMNIPLFTAERSNHLIGLILERSIVTDAQRWKPQ